MIQSIQSYTVFRSSIERWADGLKSPEMQIHGISAMKGARERPSDVAEMIMNILECNISQTGLAHFHVSTVLTLKMHKNGLEKNSKHFQLMSSLSKGTLAQPETWGKVPFVVFYGLFFYSVRKLGSFDILLVFFSTVCF